jgi:hypothetical protein
MSTAGLDEVARRFEVYGFSFTFIITGLVKE